MEENQQLKQKIGLLETDKGTHYEGDINHCQLTEPAISISNKTELKGRNNTFDMNGLHDGMTLDPN